MVGKTIHDLKNGESVSLFFVIRKKDLKNKKDGEPFLNLEFGDKSGRISGRVWDNARVVHDSLDIGKIVKVEGKVTSYRDELYITVQQIRAAVAEDNVDQSQFLPETDKNLRILNLRLFSFINSLSKPYIKELLHLIFDDIEFKNRFMKAPAAKLWHQNYLGGLLEHTLQVTDICDKVLANYPGVKRDILIAGALLHDIGKVDELSIDGFIDYSDEGRLLGHIVMGYELVAQKIAQVQNFPKPAANQILHIILSHHGLKEQGAPVVPMTLEAMIMHGADYLDSQASAFTRIIHKEKDSGGKWSKYVNLINRYLYLGEND